MKKTTWVYNPKFLKCDITWLCLMQSASRLESRGEVQMRVADSSTI